MRDWQSRLLHVLGPCVHFDEKTCLRYATDKSPGLSYRPEAVALPQTPLQVQQLLDFANAENMPLIPRGAGTGTTGGALAAHGGIVVSMEAMNRIVEIDPINRVGVVEPGVITGNFQAAVEAQGLFYPPDPASLAKCSLGGNVAENAGGPRAVKYGVTGQFVLGLAGFFGDGTPFRLGGKRLKDVAGYDMMRLLIGSEGTLAILTEITFKLLPFPPFRRVFLAGFEAYSDALSALALLQKTVQPSAIELTDQRCLRAVETQMGRPLPGSQTRVQLLIEVDGFDENQVQTHLTTALDLAKASNATVLEPAHSEADTQAFWALRRGISEALKQLCPAKISHDITVPISEIEATMAYLETLETRFGIPVLGYGHLGDGNLHINILPQNPETDPVYAVVEALFAHVVKVGGTLSGEHGIGLSKKAFMPLMFSTEILQKMQALKTVFDPKNILNPGKLL
ncbi:MAG: FAD-binding oxidoreductase [Candidatus Margulisiibacteriota bacterium]